MLSIIICCCPAVQCQALLQASFLSSRVSFFARLIHWCAAYAPGQFSFMGKHRTNRWSQEWSDQFINLLNKVLYWYSPSYQGSLGYYLFHKMETLLSPSPTLPRLWPYVSLCCGDLEGTNPLEALGFFPVGVCTGTAPTLRGDLHVSLHFAYTGLLAYICMRVIGLLLL